MSERECNIFCNVPGVGKDKCGGRYVPTIRGGTQFRMTIYAMPRQPVVDGWSQSGCYNDAWDRTLSGQQFDADPEMTTAKCGDLCSGYKFFGVESKSYLNATGS